MILFVGWNRAWSRGLAGQRKNQSYPVGFELVLSISNRHLVLVAVESIDLGGLVDALKY